MRRRLWVFLYCLLAFVLVAACGDSPSSAPEVAVEPGVLHTDGVRADSFTLLSGSATQSGLDFVNGVYHGASGGDLYYLDGSFWANNAGQRGVIDVGSCTSPNSVTTFPTSGYSQGAVAASTGHCYVVMNQVLSSDVRDLAIFRVLQSTPAKVTFQYKLVASGDFGATLVSGDSFKGGYDFFAKQYLGSSGGDFYFVSGAFWANNSDQRGVTDIGSCPTVDSVTTPPKTTPNRFNVPAVVGHCYVSPLHWYNRKTIVFRVDALTPTTVTITWRLLALPLDQLAWQHCEPWHNPTAVPPTTTASTLTDWLALHPAITDAMQWITPVPTLAPTPPVTVGYYGWPAEMQQLLSANFVAYWSWYAGGMVGNDPTPVVDPPPNQHLTTSGGDITTALAPSDAEALYVKYVALSLVVELQGQVPWSLLQFDTASLAELLGAQKFFVQYTTEGYQLVSESVVPAPPLVSATFVAQHHFLCSNKPESIAEAVFWARGLKHFGNSPDLAGDERDFWQYPGNPPASRVLAGTHYTGTKGWQTNLMQWTAGCHGTTGLLKSLLRTINIPVEHFDHNNPFVSQPTNAFFLNFTAHAVPHFISEHLWMSHGDDPYIGISNDSLPFPLQALEIDDNQFFAWFPNGGALPSIPIGRQDGEIAIAYGTQSMLYARLKDLQTTPLSDTNLCASLSNNPWYTCAQAEAAGIREMLDPLLQPYLAPGSLQTVLAPVPEYFLSEAQFYPPPCDTCVAAACTANSACCTSWSNECASTAWTICQDTCPW